MPQETMTGLLSRVREREGRLRTAQEICATCSGTEPLEGIECESIDCGWYYERKRAETKVEDSMIVHELIEEMSMMAAAAEADPESRTELQTVM